MYSGFITSKRVVAAVGIHQRLDSAAYRMIKQYLPAAAFPDIKSIIHFEGYNGPDGLNTKEGLRPKGLSPKTKHEHRPSHLYDPVTDTGDVPRHIAGHYDSLVTCLSSGDMIRASFEASWMAHYVGDGLTPAHHWPLETKIAEAAARATEDLRTGDSGKIRASLRKNWAIWGAKGHLTTHMNFELGIAFALLIFPIRPEFSEHELARARLLGPIEYFKSEAREVAQLDLYNRFYKEGWNNDIAIIVKNHLAPRVARTIGLIWLLAMLEAGQQLVMQAETSDAP